MQDCFANFLIANGLKASNTFIECDETAQLYTRVGRNRRSRKKSMIDFILEPSDMHFKAYADCDVDARPPQQRELRHSDHLPIRMDVELAENEGMNVESPKVQPIRLAQLDMDFTSFA
eukprot:8792952-Pyramimonas_sp.AAC.1